MFENDIQPTACGQTVWRLGAVSYLNSRPLVNGLQQNPRVRLQLDVPSRLAPRLLAGEFDAALIPVAELLRPGADLAIVSDACIAADGETLTVRVFSNVPPRHVQRMWVDSHSRSSVTLARVMWPDLYGREIEFLPLPEGQPVETFETVLLIGDKVVAVDPESFRYQVDLGGAWKTWTGLPFVFAVWAAPRGLARPGLGTELSRARDQALGRLAEIAVEHGPALGWPVELAQEYLQRYIRYSLTEKYVEGMVRFLDLARPHVRWPQPGPDALCSAALPVT